MDQPECRLHHDPGPRPRFCQVCRVPRCPVVQIDLLDAPGQHASSARGLLKPALELYRLVPGEPPTTAESRLLWDIGEAVHRYVDRIFDGGLLCPCGPRAKDDAPGPPGDAPP